MNRLLRAVLVSTVCLSPLAAQAADEPVVKVETAPAAEAPALNIAPDVRKVLDDVRDAYAKLTSLELAGTISANYVVGAEKQINSDTFTSTFQAPNKFRHEMKDDMLIGST